MALCRVYDSEGDAIHTASIMHNAREGLGGYDMAEMEEAKRRVKGKCEAWMKGFEAAVKPTQDHILSEDAVRAALKPIPTPALDKLRAVSHISQHQGEFLDWLASNGYFVCQWTEYDDAPAEYAPVTLSIEKLLAEYHEIDLDACEKERQAILDWIHEQHEGKPD